MFHDRVVIVTGAGAGIGAATVARFLDAGARVLAVDTNRESLESLVAAHETTGRGFLDVIESDVRDPEAPAELLTHIDRAGRLDVLVNNVGDYRPAGNGIVGSSEPQWQRLYEVNLLHVLRCCHSLSPRLSDGSGAIVNVATVEAFRGIPGQPAYGAFKAGVVSLTRSLAVELGARGIRVNAIAPDLVETEQVSAEIVSRGRAPDLVRQWVPLGRFGRADEAAGVITFLASSQASYVTGVTIPVDGGTLASSGWFPKGDGTWSNTPTEI